jgi:hypothetical protein
MQKLLLFLNFLQIICVFCCCFIALRTFKSHKNYPYIIGFYWYPVLSSALGVFTIFDKFLFPYLEYYWELFFNKISFTLHLFLIGLLIYRSLLNTLLKKIYIRLFSIFSLFHIIIQINTLTSQKSLLIQLTVLIFLITLCLFYFYDLFLNNPNRTLLKEPAFWVTTGVFLCQSLSIPTFLLKHLFFESFLPINAVVSAMASLAYSLMYLFFIKAFLCTTSPPAE